MKPVYHPYWEWEDWNAGMWRRPSKDEEDELTAKAVEFTGNAELYGSFMIRVTQEWPNCCEQNLLNVSMNRRAWVGHAAACLAIGSPESITRRAWWMLTEEQRIAADRQADRAIALYVNHRRSVASQDRLLF